MDENGVFYLIFQKNLSHKRLLLIEESLKKIIS